MAKDKTTQPALDIKTDVVVKDAEGNPQTVKSTDTSSKSASIADQTINPDVEGAPTVSTVAKAQSDDIDVALGRKTDTVITIAALLAIASPDRPKTWYNDEAVTIVRLYAGTRYSVETEHFTKVILESSEFLSLVPPATPKARPAMWHEDADKLASWWNTVKQQASHFGIEDRDVRRQVAVALGTDDPTKLLSGTGKDAMDRVINHFKAIAIPEPPETPQTSPSEPTPSVDTPKPVETAQSVATTTKPSQLTIVKNETAVAVPTGDTKWDVMRQQADVMLKSGFMPQAVNTVEKIVTIGLMSDALQLPMIVGINNINVIQGKPTVSPQLMLALIRRTGQLENMKVEDDGETCTVTVKRKGESEHVETFSMEDAKAMGLIGKDNWRKQPKTMRKWRAISAAARIVFPDAIWGLYTTEELDNDFPMVEVA